MLLRKRYPVETVTDATHRPLAEPFPTGASWLARAVAVSFVLHAIVAGMWWWLATPEEKHEVELVDIEVAPPPPKAEALPEEVARLPEAPTPAQAAATEPSPAEEEHEATIDAGIDAPIDAPKKKRKDAATDAEPMLVAEADGGVDGGDGDAQLAMTGSGAGSNEGSGAGPGMPGAIAEGSGSGAPGMDNQPAVEGAPTTAGTAANLLAYFPPGHQITVLIRFDRMRGTEWAEKGEQLFKPMPDYQLLFGGRRVSLSQKLDTLVISSPKPRDATQTTLVARTAMSRAQMRDFLANPDAPVNWSGVKGGMFGARSGKIFPGDKRVLLSPWKGWFVLAQPQDLGVLTAPAGGNMDALEAKANLPAWLAAIRTIEHESGDDKKKGPALVMTLKGPSKRYKIPDVGLGVTSAPSPERASLAMELVKQGWLVRGNIVFASEADAAEFVKLVEDVKQRVTDSRILSGLLKKQHALNVVTGLSLARTGARVSYATSVSIADARAMLTAAAALLDSYFGQPQP